MKRAVVAADDASAWSGDRNCVSDSVPFAGGGVEHVENASVGVIAQELLCEVVGDTFSR